MRLPTRPMGFSLAHNRKHVRRRTFGPAALALLVFILTIGTPPTRTVAQDGDAIATAEDVDSIMEDMPQKEVNDGAPSGIDLLTLIMRGGAFMIPIALMSLLVVALAIERALALRRKKVMPQTLTLRLGEMAAAPESFSPASAYHLCQEFPSPTGRVVSSMLLRTGRPLAEIEHAASETLDREADRYASPIRWLSLAAAATPLMGLLGTVWGMIVAFHESTTLSADRSRSEQLSEGIYTALVTTLAGLAVAIPAAILALYLENRLLKMFHHIEEIAFSIAPSLQRFTGRSRLDDEGRLQPLEHSPPPPPGSPPGAAASGTPVPPPAVATSAPPVS